MTALTIFLALVLAACGSDGDSAPAAGPSRTASSGAVEVTATPVEVSGASAVFRLAFDTHSGSLDFDPMEVVRLTTADGTLLAAGWDGPGAGGHHREGTVRFTGAGGSLAALELEVAIDPPVSFRWED